MDAEAGEETIETGDNTQSDPDGAVASEVKDDSAELDSEEKDFKA